MSVRVEKKVIENDAWAIILAGGDGFARKKLIPKSARLGAPAQFCRTLGRDYLINEIRRQTASAIPPEKTLFVVTEKHSRYFEHLLSDVPSNNLIVQPQDDGTTFAILYAALSVAKRTKTTDVLAFFPADLQTAKSNALMPHIKSAIEAVRLQPNLILLGTASKKTDGEWIEPLSEFVNEDLNVRRVRGFYNFVLPEKMLKLKQAEALRFSAVMVGTAATFLRKIRRAAPEIYAKFAPAKSAIGTAQENPVMRRIFYSHFAETDFSRDVLTKSADKLAVIDATN